jgi:glycosyltransferase involved in cell wall biosynthesis
MRGRILVVDHKTPTPDQDSGSASMFSLLQILARAGFAVTFAPCDLAKAGRYTRALEALGIETLSSHDFASMMAVIEAIGPRSDLLLLCRGTIAIYFVDLARRVAPAAKILFRPVDLHFVRMKREAVLTGREDQHDLAKAMLDIELDVILKADATIVVSNYELALLRKFLPGAAVHQIPIMREPPGTPPSRPVLDARPEDRRGIVFIGGFEHPPNADAVLWFVRDIWPRLLSTGFPDPLILVGSKMPEEIRALASDTIEVRGYVADLAPVFAACRLSVAPLRFGGGVKGKIVTSLSHGVPVVATSVAAEGMGLRREQDILVADTPDGTVEQIRRLYDDPTLWRRLSSNGLRAFQETFSLDAGAGKFLAVVDGLIGSKEPC